MNLWVGFSYLTEHFLSLITYRTFCPPYTHALSVQENVKRQETHPESFILMDFPVSVGALKVEYPYI